MSLVTPNVAIAIFGGVIVVSALIAWKFKQYNKYDTSSFHTFIAILAGLGVVVTFMFYYNIVQLQQQQQMIASVQELARINDSDVNKVLEETKNASAIIPNFILSISPLNNTICCDCVPPPDPVTPQTCTLKMIISYRIFALWQDVILSNKFIGFNARAYISTFLQEANSTQLYDQWKISMLNFDDIVQVFGELLFEYGLPITNQTVEQYQQATTELISDPRYQNIFK